MDSLILALTILVIEVIVILLLVFALHLFKNLKTGFVSVGVPEENKLQNINAPEILLFSRHLHEELDSLMKKYSDISKELKVAYPINEKHSNAPLIITYYNSVYDYLISEISAVDSGLLSPSQLSKRENDVKSLIKEFKSLETGIQESESSSKEQITSLKQKLISLEEQSTNSLAYYTDLKQENIVTKKSNKELQQQHLDDQKAVAELTIEVSRLRKEADLFSSTREVSNNVNAFNAPVVDMEDKISEKEKEVSEKFRSELEGKEAELIEKEKQFENERSSFNDERADFDTERASFDDKCKEYEKVIANLKEEIDKYKQEYEDIVRDRAGDADLIGSLKVEHENLKTTIEETNERIKDLEEYKNRFNELHKQVSTESSANVNFREEVRDTSKGTDLEDEIDILINEYEEVRSDLDEFLERPDVAPLSPGKEPVSNEVFEQTCSDIEYITSSFSDDISRDAGKLEESNEQQVGIISTLKDQLNEVTLDRDRLIGELLNLEGKVLGSKDIIVDLEKQISEGQTKIESLQSKLKTISEKGRDIGHLEQTIERFSRQSMDMMQQLTELEDENKHLKEQLDINS